MPWPPPSPGATWHALSQTGGAFEVPLPLGWTLRSGSSLLATPGGQRAWAGVKGTRAELAYNHNAPGDAKPACPSIADVARHVGGAVVKRYTGRSGGQASVVNVERAGRRAFFATTRFARDGEVIVLCAVSGRFEGAARFAADVRASQRSAPAKAKRSAALSAFFPDAEPLPEFEEPQAIEELLAVFLEVRATP